MMMSSYYTLLGLEPGASPEELEAAYARQRERYDPARVADDPELRAVAVERSAEIERAYAVLASPERRRQYDASLSGAGGGVAAGDGTRRGLSPRERNFALIGALVAIALVGLIWVLTEREGGVAGQAMPELNRAAPDFSLPSLAGESISLADYQGQVVLLNFWGTWCEPCKRELPALEQAHQRYGDQGLAVIGVNLTDDELAQGRDEAIIQAFLDQFGVTYPTALDIEGDVTNAYRVFPLPTSFFIDGEGRIRYVHIGELTFDDVTARFLELSGQAQIP
jgi:cytochrome c biogenesis protein CcmG, thiol:disulfide interchange protein DsbE